LTTLSKSRQNEGRRVPVDLETSANRRPQPAIPRPAWTDGGGRSGAWEGFIGNVNVKVGWGPRGVCAGPDSLTDGPEI